MPRKDVGATRLAASIGRSLERAIRPFPVEFFSSFKYVKTGNNLTHSLILGELVRIVRRLPYVHHVGIDVRLNAGSGIKFQPDLVAYDQKLDPLFFIDYESPNSSDARIPVKDIEAYRKWTQISGKRPYLIVTTLPDTKTPKWELRYTAKGQYNEAFKGQQAKVRKNPFMFWRSYWKRCVGSKNLDGIAVLNIDRKRVRRVRLIHHG